MLEGIVTVKLKTQNVKAQNAHVKMAFGWTHQHYRVVSCDTLTFHGVESRRRWGMKFPYIP